MAKSPAIPPARRLLLECSGACGDLGTFIPHVIGAITVAGLAPVEVLLGFAIFLIATGLFYGLPLPVQPMKAISAVILTAGLRPGEVAAAGVVLLVLGITGWIGRLARAIPHYSQPFTWSAVWARFPISPINPRRSSPFRNSVCRIKTLPRTQALAGIM